MQWWAISHVNRTERQREAGFEVGNVARGEIDVLSNGIWPPPCTSFNYLTALNILDIPVIGHLFKMFFL